MRIAYLGPSGTYSEEIALYLYSRQQIKFVPHPDIHSAIKAVESGEVQECVVPIENSLEGSVNITLDTLAHDVNLFITREIIKPINHYLLVKEDTGPIVTIFSHAQALAQCRHYLTQHYPGAARKPVESTAEAASLVANGNGAYAAIGSLRAREIYGLKIAAQNIQDRPNNCTRFIVLGRQQAPLQSFCCKTSLVCQINGERPGSLYSILQEFAQRNVNLTKIESRPARTALGQYIFFFDIEGSMDNPSVCAAIDAIQPKTHWLKNLGSYSHEI